MKSREEPQTVDDTKSESFEKLTIKLAGQGCKCPETAVLKLKIINLSSQNYTLKRKIAELSVSLKRSRSYELAFGNVVKVTRELMRKQGVSESRVSEELNNIVLGRENYEQSILAMNKEMLLATKQSNIKKMIALNPLKTYDESPKHSPKSNQSNHKANEDNVLSRLTQNDERETIKSLDLSLDSHTSAISKQKQGKKNQLQILRRDYESVRESLETVYNLKTRLVLQELEELRSENQQLKNRLIFATNEDKFHKEDKEEESETNARETAYFSVHCDHISQQEHEESIVGDRSSNSSIHSCTFPFIKQLQIQKLPSLSQQIKSLKQTLKKLHYLFDSLSPEFMELLDTYYSLKKNSKEIKIISLDEYLSLLSCKKQEIVQNSQYRANEKQIERLKSIVRQFI